MRKLAKELNIKLKETNEAKTYFAIKNQIEKDEYILSLLEVIKDTQKKMQNYLKENDLANYKIQKQTLEVLKDEFYNLPIINNYINTKEELYNLLEQVINIISVE